MTCILSLVTGGQVDSEISVVKVLMFLHPRRPHDFGAACSRRFPDGCTASPTIIEQSVAEYGGSEINRADVRSARD
jgi:hypothetical protein